MKLPFWILVLVAAVIAVMLVLPNVQPTRLTVWPFGYTLELPLYLLVFAAVFIGFVLGWTGCWFSQGRWRRLARERARRIEYLERESLTLTDKIVKLEEETATQSSAGRDLTIAGPTSGSHPRSGTTGV